VDITSWIDAVGESIKSDQVTIAILIGLAIAGYKWVSKIDGNNRADHAKLSEKVDDLRDIVSKGFEDHLSKWHNPPTGAVKRAPKTTMKTTQKAAKKAAKK
jgi:hypothetical protein